ncbi:MAG: DUF2284 domain-containing protein [Deltaproteobacteria bacterium]
MRKTAEELRKSALKLGARQAKVIKASTIKTAGWVRRKCQFGCSGYGQCLTCPPRSPKPEETRQMLEDYKKAIMVQVTDREHAHVSGIVSKLEREAFLAGYHKAFGMGAGPCTICNTCDFEGGCRHPEKARPALEACGIDVFTTARANGLPIETLDDQDSSKAHYYGIVLLE